MQKGTFWYEVTDGLKRYWRWTSGGGIGRFALGLSIPTLGALFLLAVALTPAEEDAGATTGNPSGEPFLAAVPTPSPELNRRDCPAIRAQPEYLSEGERAWFQQNCTGNPAAVATSSGGSEQALIDDLVRAQPTQRPVPYELALLSSRCVASYGFMKCEGFVENLTAQSMRSVMVVVTWYDANGVPQRSDDSFIDYNPVLPGQSSPWSTINTDNPGLRNYKIQFKEFLGGTILTRDDRP